MPDLFDKYIERVLSHEGGYVNNPKDPGGETKWGISKRAYPTVNISTLTREGAIALYRRDYWEGPHINELPPALAFQVFDAAINHGRARAIGWLQSAVGATSDGRIGPVTLGRVEAYRSTIGDKAIALLFLAQRLQFYTDIEGWTTFGKGWARRTAINMRYAAND